MLKKKNRKSRVPLIGFILYLILLTVLVIVGYDFFHVKVLPQKPVVVSPVVSQKEPLIDTVKKTLIKDNIQFSQVVASDSSYLVFLKDGSQIILPEDYDVEAKLNSLQVILKQFTIEGKTFQQIDFRFDKPTVIF